MNEDLRNRIIADLEKSGFASEMNAIRLFLDRGWRCSGGSSYYDRDEYKSREIDIGAYRPVIEKNSAPHISCFFHIIAEVKKSDKPWVMFKSRVKKPLDAWNNLIFRDNLPLSGDNMVRELSSKSLLATYGWQAYGIHESFKNPNQPSQWYGAAISACKAAEDVLSAESWETNQGEWEPAKTIHFIFVKPVIIFDGLLLSAEREKDGSLNVEHVSAAPISFVYRTASYRKPSYSLDVVALGSLDEYVAATEDRHRDIIGGIKRMVKKAMKA